MLKQCPPPKKKAVHFWAEVLNFVELVSIFRILRNSNGSLHKMAIMGMAGAEKFEVKCSFMMEAYIST